MLKGSDWSEGALMLVALVLAGCAVGRTSWRGDLKVWGDPTAICISAPCTQSMPCIGHFAEGGGYWQEAVQLQGNFFTSLHLFSSGSKLAFAVSSN